MKELSISDLKNIDRNYITADDVVHVDGVPFKVHVNGVTFKMIKVSGGTFNGLTLSDYWIGETAVTQELWQAVMGTDVYDYDSGRGNYFPVYYVSWDDICGTGGFLEKLNAALSSELGGMRFALPSEAQWEFAARGGNSSHGYKYAGSNTINDVAWYWDNILSKYYGEEGYGTQPVRTKSPNELGLYDMNGNVWEWCADRYGSSPAGDSRVLRGGSWINRAEHCRVSDRDDLSLDSHNSNVGFRLVLLP